MTILEIILIIIIWILYGIYNAKQHNWYFDCELPEIGVIFNIIFAPIALVIRLFRGIFLWDGEYK